MDKYIGTKLDGRFQMEELIGEGGMADVYRALDLKDNRNVAMKILKDEYYNNEEIVRQFKNESRAISVLNHSNIVKVYDVSVDDKIHYIAMEYIDGITLKEYIEQRGEPLTYKETIHFIGQILQAMQHAHDKGIIHRDIKPQNIMIVEDGTIKVMDFGIARLARSENHAVSDQAVGSVHYISPEQAKGEPTDQRADIYSVGIMMYEMLTSTLPFESDDVVAIAIKQISDEAPSVKVVNPAAPEGLSEITQKAMAKQPHLRYQSAMDMMRDIEAFKRNPSIKFEYDYLLNNAPTRHIDKMTTNGKRPASRGGARNTTGGRGRANKKKKVGITLPIALGLTIAVVGVCALICWNLLMNTGNPLFTKFEDIELPNFVGMQYDEVKGILKQDPYKFLRIEDPKQVNNLSVVAGEVVSQNPTSNNDNKKKVKANQKLYLTVSMGIQDITVPNVSGMSRNEAVKLILEMGLRPYAKKVEDSTVPIGRAIGTDPAVGAVVQNLPDTVITIFVSGNPKAQEQAVPNVVGCTSETDAFNRLKASNMTLGAVITIVSEEAAGTVIVQSPKAGVMMTLGTPVNITVSEGPPPPVEEAPADPGAGGEVATVPNVVGQDQDSAQAALEAAGFGAREGGTAYSDVYPEGSVYDQSPDGGTQLTKGLTISLFVSRGTRPTDTHDPPVTDPEPPEEDDDDESLDPGADIEATGLSSVKTVGLAPVPLPRPPIH